VQTVATVDSSGKTTYQMALVEKSSPERIPTFMGRHRGLMLSRGLLAVACDAETVGLRLTQSCNRVAAVAVNV